MYIINLLWENLFDTVLFHFLFYFFIEMFLFLLLCSMLLIILTTSISHESLFFIDIFRQLFSLSRIIVFAGVFLVTFLFSFDLNFVFIVTFIISNLIFNDLIYDLFSSLLNYVVFRLISFSSFFPVWKLLLLFTVLKNWLFLSFY